MSYYPLRGKGIAVSGGSGGVTRECLRHARELREEGVRRH